MKRPISFSDLRSANVDRVELFGHGSLEDGWNPAEWGNALAGETGELCNLLKKYIRQLPTDPTREDLVTMAAEEMADIIIYLDLIGAKLDIDLADAVRSKFNKVSDIFRFPQKLK